MLVLWKGRGGGGGGRGEVWERWELGDCGTIGVMANFLSAFTPNFGGKT